MVEAECGCGAAGRRDDQLGCRSPRSSAAPVHPEEGPTACGTLGVVKDPALLLQWLDGEPDRTRRGLLLAAILGEESGSDVIVVGGFAVECWTRGGYTTADLDLVCSRPEDVRLMLTALGFSEIGRHRVHTGLGLAVDVPGSVLAQGRDAYDRLVSWRIAGHNARILSLEDTIVDRLAALRWGGATGEAENVARLARSWWGELDLHTLRALARGEGVEDTLDEALRALGLADDAPG